jgi:hypothetical protein
MQRQTKIGVCVGSLLVLALLPFQLHFLWNGSFDRYLDNAVQYVRIAPRHFVLLPSGSYLKGLVPPIALTAWGLMELYRSRTETLRTAGFFLAITAGLTFLLALVVWLLGPDQPASVMALSLPSTLLIRITQAVYFTCIDLESIAIMFLVLSASVMRTNVHYITPYRCSSPNLVHRQKVERIVRELEAKGLDRSTTAPGIFRLLWTLGVPIPPPLFLGVLPAILIFGVSFALGTAAFLWLMVQCDVLWLSAIGGGVFGLVMSAYIGRKAKTLHLPAWKDYGLD